ncbi:class I adenylate cyclase [Shewanella sedimentimangrovi]|uniref:Class I adenylate cyclase n=1 Tax=Shewanella sedimentimangrovi TaxID=2814293 RepID=A0ABX7R0A5_9GAMM|nr:class I adenylate cyclase [Shewanella sedimentimangrovi]QSX36934.1 class I adenylate cyclase [Shewanella sedimentimangrovi]
MLRSQVSHHAPIELSERLNCVRQARALALLTPLQRHLFHSISLLLHFHGPRLPGYNGHETPCGIADFALIEEMQQAAKTLSLTLPKLVPELPAAIEGVYAMGSTGTLGQNPRSDLDIWVIHDAAMQGSELSMLKDKLHKLHLWYEGYGFEVNFYLVHPQQFSAGKPHGQRLATEHSGSAQHWLLLEEFYRSQIRLSGRPLAWWPQASKFPECLSLGDEHNLPASEYFSASLWQLYKGLANPHKALLKVMLLETYAVSYPKTVLLTDKVWQHTCEGDFSSANDPYFLLYEAVEQYLLQKEDWHRLEIVRRCFYLKCGVRLSWESQARDWRWHKLKKLVGDWAWPESLIQTLDDCEHWHSGQLQWFNAQLNELLLASYQTLLHFASAHGLREGLRIEELGMLTRKLHTFFREDKQQIIKFNRLWSQSVLEPELLLRRDSDGAFSLYRKPEGADPATLLFQSDSLARLIAWACINGVCDGRSRWTLTGELPLSAKDVRQLTERILPWVAGRSPKVSKQDLCHPWHYRKAIVLLNIEQDPSIAWEGQEVMVDVTHANLFSLGRKQRNVLGSIDLLLLNSWGEWQCCQFNGEEALLEALTFMMPGLRRADEDVVVEVISCAAKLSVQLEIALSTLLKRLLAIGAQVKSSSTLMQPLQVGKRRFGLFFNTMGLKYQDLSDAKSLYQQVFHTELLELPRPDMGDDPFSSAPEVIQQYAAAEVIQYFLRPREEGLDVFILNADNELSHFIQHGSHIEELVSKVSCQHVFDGLFEVKRRFNLPQFFLLERCEGELRVLPFANAMGAQREEMGAEL